MSRLSVSTLLVVLSLALPATAVDLPEGDGPARAAPGTSGRLIVQLEDAPLAVYWHSAGASAASGSPPRLDLSSPTALQYLDLLSGKQAAFKTELARAMPEARVDAFRDSQGVLHELTYQVSFNGIALRLPDAGPATMRRLQQMPGVKAVYPDNRYEPNLYASLPLIGASALWNQVGGQANAGAGVKVALIDTGVYAPNPFFGPTGFVYPPGFPRGDTRYTTEKVIAARAYFRDWDPPLAGDDTPWPGAAGSSHGTHVAGIVAGNANTAAPSFNVTLSSVAPRAQLLNYRVFYPTTSSFSGSAFAAEIIAAIEDAIADGADVINNSWGSFPGTLPCAVPEVLALEAAWDAGIVVVAAAGNDGPAPGSASIAPSASPRLISVGWSSTTGNFTQWLIDVTGPGTAPEQLTTQSFGVATFCPLPTGLFGPYPFVDVAAVTQSGAATLCNNEPVVGALSGKIAVINGGVCAYSDKIWNAQQAGAVAAVVYNDQGDWLINMPQNSHQGYTFVIPGLFVSRSFGQGLVAWYAAHPADAALQIDMTPRQLGNVPDVVYEYSARGPAFGRWIRPDVTAPGVSILSSGFADADGTGRHAGFGQAGGSSMACAHVSGAAALLRQLFPDWTPDQIKSALMSTAQTDGVFNDPLQADPAGVLDLGAGRLDLTQAGDPGLTFRQPSLSFGTVRPLASWSGAAIITATDVSGAGETYHLSVEGQPELQASTAVSDIFVPAGGTASFELLVHIPEGTAPADYTGNLWLRGDRHEAHLPFWVRLAAPLRGADILLIDNDFSSLRGYPDYTAFYTRTLEELGISYDVWEADRFFANPQSVPPAPELTAYKAIIYFSGDHYEPDGTYGVATPLTKIDQFVLSDYLDAGGRLLASGQDLASATDTNPSPDPMWGRSPLYRYYLGARYFQDDLFNPGNSRNLPPVPSLMGVPGSPLAGMTLDISGSAPITAEVGGKVVTIGWADGAANQFYVDEIGPGGSLNDPALDSVRPWLVAVGGNPRGSGYVAVARSDEPTLEKPDLRYTYRTAYLSFGFEGINSHTGFSTRAQVLDCILGWLLDDVSVQIVDDPVTHSAGAMVTLRAAVTGTEGMSYRWDFADGSPSEMTTAPQAVHAYHQPGIYHPRVEVTDALGHKAVSNPGTVSVAPLPVFLPIVCSGAWMPN